MKAGEERLSAAGSPLGQEDCAPMGVRVQAPLGAVGIETGAVLAGIPKG